NAAGTKAYVTKRASGSVAIVDVATHTQTDTAIVPASPYPILVTPDGATGYTISTNGWLYKLDLTSKTRTDSAPAAIPSFFMAFGPGDSLLYFSSHNGTVTEVRTATLSILRTFTVGGTLQA